MTGDFDVLAGSVVRVLCRNDGSLSEPMYHAEVTAVQVNGISSEVSKRPAQRFTRPAHAPGLR
jgi:hypothetical protein